MSKLNTAAIKAILPSRLDWYYAMFKASDQNLVRECVTNPKNWRRLWKSQWHSAGQAQGYESPEEYLEGCDEEHILDPKAITNDCIVRFFVCPDYTLDCYVVTDPKDEVILRIFWHQD